MSNTIAEEPVQQAEADGDAADVARAYVRLAPGAVASCSRSRCR